MRNEITELEHHEMFSNHLKKLRNGIDELNKMLECRIDYLTKPLCESDLNPSSYKTMRSETLRAIDQAEEMCRLLYKRLNENTEKSFQRIEEVESRNEKG